MDSKSSLATENPVPITTRVILITGAGSGIGRACSIALAQEFKHEVVLILTGRREAELKVTERLIGAGNTGTVVSVIPCDVTNEADVVTLFTTIRINHTRLDVLFNNAGISLPPTPIEELSLQQWQAVVNVNLTGKLFFVFSFQIFSRHHYPPLTNTHYHTTNTHCIYESSTHIIRCFSVYSKCSEADEESVTSGGSDY